MPDRLHDVIIERSMDDQWLSNTYLVADELGSHAVMIDAGGPVAPLLDVLDRMRFQLTHVLLTHHHHDHVAQLDQVLERHPGTPVLIHPLELALVPGATGTMEPGQTIQSGALEIEPIHTPGHTAGMLALLVNGHDLFTGDTLFKGSVGGVHAPGSTTYADLRSSVMDTLLKLPPRRASTLAIRIRPPWPTSSSTTSSCASGAAWTPRAMNPARRSISRPRWCCWRRLRRGYKAWIRWPDGTDDIVPGSRVPGERVVNSL